MRWRPLILWFVVSLVVAEAGYVLLHSRQRGNDVERFNERVTLPMNAIASVIEIEAQKGPLQFLSIRDLNQGVRTRASWARNPCTGGQILIVDADTPGKLEPGTFVFGLDPKAAKWFLAAIDPGRRQVLTRFIEDYKPPQ